MATVSLCMIVKNEEEVLERCLKCAGEVADEIIIVDTGSTDKTKEIAARFTDKIYDYQWNDDFAAARNYSFSKATKDYCMWLDADDVIQESEQQKIKELKGQLTPDISAVMMKYVTAFDDNGNPAFLFDRERMLRTQDGYRWSGRVHEAITVRGKVVYSDARIEHHSIKKAYGQRNLNIYEKMIEEGETLEPRHQFYYGRELYYHGRYEDAVSVFDTFLENREQTAWIENLVDACRFCSLCLYGLGKNDEALNRLFKTFTYDVPRPQICCDIGKHFLDAGRLKQSEYWYRQAMQTSYEPIAGAFVEPEYREYIPAIQLSVCLDRQGRYIEAERYNELAAYYKPDSEAVKLNRKYFQDLIKEGAASQ